MEKAVFYSICLYYYRSVAGYKKMGWKNGLGMANKNIRIFMCVKPIAILLATYLLSSNSFSPFRSDI